MSELSAPGIIVGHKTWSSGDFNRTVYPVVRFETQDGQTVEFESSTGSSVPLKVGEQATSSTTPSAPRRLS